MNATLLSQVIEKLSPDGAERLALTLVGVAGSSDKPDKTKGWVVPKAGDTVRLLNPSTCGIVPTGSVVRVSGPSTYYTSDGSDFSVCVEHNGSSYTALLKDVEAI